MAAKDMHNSTALNGAGLDGLVLDRVVVNFDEGKVLEAKVSDPPLFHGASVQVAGLSDGDHAHLIDQMRTIAGDSASGEAVIERREGQVFFNDRVLDDDHAMAFSEVLYMFHPLLQI